MSRFHSHINTAKNILSLYDGNIPFSAFLKNFFKNEKKYGSGDRRRISSLCYNYFRTGKAITESSVDEKLLIGLFLCTNSPDEILQNERPEWNEKIKLPLEEKIRIVSINIENIFPFSNELSAGIDTKAFNISFLIQPKLFARLRPGKHEIVTQKLKAAQISFEEIGQNCLAFENRTRLEEVVDINREATIQDLNSKRVGELMSRASSNMPVHLWDCCAASGGKSIMAYDMFPNLRLTVSDVRQSILYNLHSRFTDAGIKDYQPFVADLTNYKNLHTILRNKKFDFIICDAPCSGSGTWSRTPEQLMFFKDEQIVKYSNLQKSIVSNTIPFLQKNGYFLYITCSVFKKENEEITDFIQQKFSLKLVKIKLLKGYEIRADTMFAALFQLS